MKRIELILKNEKNRRYHLVAWLLGALNLVILLSLSFNSRYSQHRIGIYVACAFILVLLTIGRIPKFNLKENKNNISYLFCVIVLAWINPGLYWIAALNLVFSVLYIYAVRKFEVIVTDNEITYPSFPKRKIGWNELQNMILKDGILTIDFRNNKIIQNETEDNGVDERKFNEFCREQLSK